MKLWKEFAPLIALAAIGCSSANNATPANSPASGELQLVAFAQANSADPWRQVFDAEIKKAAALHTKDFSFEEQSAEDDPTKQTSQIETLMLKSPTVLLISPTTEAVQGAVEKVFDAGVPVVLLDRAIPGDKYTCVIASDNTEIGRQAGKYIVDKLHGNGTVLMIQGLGGVTATAERKKGAEEIFAKSPGIKVIQGDDCKFQRQAAQNYMETFLQSGKPFDAVYAHNDEMAIGAYLAWTHAGNKGKRPIFVGIDGCQKEMIDYIKNGQIDATFKYSVPGPAGIEVAAQLLKGVQPKQKKIVLPTEQVNQGNAAQYLASNPNLAK